MRLMDGDRAASLFDAHADRLYRLARRLTPTADAASDLVQETFLRAARSLHSIPEGGEEAWLVRVLVNVRRDEWRKAGVRQRFAAMFPSAGHGSADPSDALIAHATVWKAMERLAPRRRAVIVMHEMDGRPVADIAVLLGISAVTVRWHLARGRQELRKLIRPHSGDAHDEEHAQHAAAERRPGPSRTPTC